MIAFAVSIAVVICRCRRVEKTSFDPHVVPPASVQADRQRTAAPRGTARHVLPVGEIYDRMLDGAHGIQAVLDQRPAETARLTRRFLRSHVIRRVRSRWSSPRPFPTLPQFVALCQAFHSNQRRGRFAAAACAAAVRTLEMHATGDPPADQVWVDIE